MMRIIKKAIKWYCTYAAFICTPSGVTPWRLS